MNYYTYALVDPRLPFVPRYVGVTNKPSRRISNHISDATTIGARTIDLIRPKSAWIRSLLSDGVKPSIMILGSHAEEHAEIAEKAVIAECRSMGFDLFNISDGGRGPCGFKQPMAANIARSETQRGHRLTDRQLEKLKHAATAWMHPVSCIETGESFPSQKEAALFYGVSKRTMFIALNTGRPVKGRKLVRHSSRKLLALARGETLGTESEK